MPLNHKFIPIFKEYYYGLQAKNSYLLKRERLITYNLFTFLISFLY